MTDLHGTAEARAKLPDFPARTLDEYVAALLTMPKPIEPDNAA